MPNYLPNPLGKYTTYSYKIELHMCHPSHSHDLNKAVTNGKTKIMIDQTRFADYFIQEVEQVFTCAYSNNTRSGIASMFNIQVVEPNGVTFLEQIVMTAKELQIFNHTQAHYLLKISFNGRKEDGSTERHPAVFWYPIFIKSVSIDVNEGGATYAIQAVETGAAGFNYLENVAKSGLTVAASTFGDFITELEDVINKTAADLTDMSPNALFPNTYKITLDSDSGAAEWQDWKIQQSGDSKKTGISTDKDGKQQFVIPAGTNITDAIGIALMSTEEYKKLYTTDGDFAKTDGSGEYSKAKLDKIKTVYRVVANVIATDWDPFLNDYAKEISYKVTRFEIPTQVSDISEYSNILNSANQKARANKLTELGVLRKRYDYMFTGLNTEILNLDVKFDYAYYMVTPIGNGKLGDANVTKSLGAGDEAKSPIDRLTAAKNDLNDAKSALKQAKSKYRSSTNKQSLGDGGIRNASREIAQRELSAAEQVYSKTLTALKRERGIFQTEKSKTAPVYTSKRTTGGIDMPIRFASDHIDLSDYYAPENDREGGAINFGAVKANLESSGDFMQITMEIKGDPFWMGKPNTFYNNNQGGNIDLANYETGENLFLLNLNMPIQEVNGRRKPRTEYSLTGIYRVMSVINRFSEGQFTQNLKAVRDIASNISAARSAFQGTK